MVVLRISPRLFFGMEAKRSVLKKSLRNSPKRNEPTYSNFLILSSFHRSVVRGQFQVLTSDYYFLIAEKKFVYMSEMLYICAKLENLN